MKNILILAEGKTAEHFIERLNQKRIGNNRYTLVAPADFALPAKLQVQLERVEIDPTSYSKLRKLFFSDEYTMVFVLLETLEEAGESLKNIRRLDEKIRVVLLDRWDAFGKLDQSSTHVLNSNDLLANRLYDFLPGVPVVAQNVGLGEGEIMEVLVPFGSTFAYRHVGSIPQVKWRIAGIYRDKKLILPTHATMIRPQDTLLLVGRPQVLANIFARIHNREGMFPEPFGRHLYLLIEMQNDAQRALSYLQEAIYLCERLEDRELTVRIFNPGDFDLLEKLRSFENERVSVLVSYEENGIEEWLGTDLHTRDIGMVFVSPRTFDLESVRRELYDQRKLVYLYGDTPIYSVERAVILMGDDEEMEAISSTSFYIAETLELQLCLCDYDPEGEFADRRRIVEHYETLSHIFHYPVQIEQKQLNPIRAIREMKGVLQIAPFDRTLRRESFWHLFSTRIADHLLGYFDHPRLLIPVETL